MAASATRSWSGSGRPSAARRPSQPVEGAGVSANGPPSITLSASNTPSPTTRPWSRHGPGLAGSPSNGVDQISSADVHGWGHGGGMGPAYGQRRSLAAVIDMSELNLLDSCGSAMVSFAPLAQRGTRTWLSW